MTQLLNRAIARTRTMPPEMQDEVARLVLLYAGEAEPIIQLTPAEETDLREADEEIARGELATEEEMQAIWAKYRR